MGSKGYRKQPLMFGLEPRLMFDGAVVATTHAADAAAKAVSPAAVAPPAPVQLRAADPTKDGGKKEVVFIDTSVSNWQALAAGVQAGVEVELIDGSQSGLAQIATWAASHSGYDSASILSAGGEATLTLGTDRLTDASLSTATVKAELSEIGQALKPGGEILLYGSDIAEGADGHQFLADFAADTGTSVAAATHAVGASDLGGSWTLDAVAGTAGTAGLAVTGYEGLMDIGAVAAPDSPAPVLVRAADPALDGGKTEVAFIDTSVAGWQSLLAEVKPGVEIDLIDGTESGLAQLSVWAETHAGEYDAIHILSRGTEGALQLGSDELNDASLGNTVVQVDLAVIGAALKPGGEIVLYGTDIAQGADGQKFLADLSTDTGIAVVAANSATAVPAVVDTSSAAERLSGAAASAPIQPVGAADHPSQVVVVDWGVANWQDLIAGMDPSIPLIVLQPGKSGMDGLAEALSSYHGLDAIHLVTEGEAGGIFLGLHLVDDAALATDGADLAVIANALKPGGDLLLYGCSVALSATGEQFVDDLAAKLGNGIVVAASTNHTGPTALGGDWDLEYATGKVDTVLPFTLQGMQDIGHCLGCTLVGSGTFTGPTWTPGLPGYYIDKSGSYVGTVYGGSPPNASNSYVYIKSTLTTYANYVGTPLHQAFLKFEATAAGISICGALAPTVVGLTTATDTGSSNSDGITSDATPTITGTSLANTTITIKDGSTTIGSTNSDANGNWTFTPSSALTNGSNSITATDQAGSVSSAFIVVVDAAAPTISSITAPNVTSAGGTSYSFTVVYGDTGSGIDTSTLGTGNVTVTGPDGPLTVTGESYNSATHTATYTVTAPGGSWDAADAGTYTIAIGANQVKDLAGNTLPGNAVAATFLVGFGPVVTAGSTAAFTESGSGAALDSALTLSDPFSTTLTSATIQITGGLTSGDLLLCSAQNNISTSYVSSTGLLTLSGTDTLAHYQAALRSIVFNTSSHNPTNFGTAPTRTITWQVNDGQPSNNLSTTVTSTVAVTAVNNAPTIAGAGNSVSYTEAGSATPIDGSITVSDADNQDLASATVSIGGFVSGDSLNFDNQNGITGVYNSSTGMLTLTGAASVADYQAALRSITFSSSSQNPTSFGTDTSRTITWTVNDGALNSTAVTSTVAVTAVDNAPVASGAGNSVSYTEAGSDTTIDAGLTLSDVDSQNLASATVSIGGFVSGDSLNFDNQNGITGTYNSSTGVLTLSGTATLADYQAALESITFSSTAASTASRTISWTVTDTNTKTSAAVTDTVVVSPPPPTITSATYDETTGTLTVTGTGFVGTPGAANDIQIQDLALTGVNGSNYFLSTSSNVDVTSATSFTIVLSGFDLAEVNALLDTSGTHASDGTTYNLSASSQWDGATSGPVNTVGLTVNGPAPSVSLGGTTSVGYTEGGSAATLDGGLTVTDDTSATLAGATVQITGGLTSGDVLNFTAGNGISGSYDAGTGILTLSGTASVADYQAALDSVTFSSSSQNPTDFGTATSRTITWQVDDGQPSNNLSPAVTSTVAVTAVDNAPAIAGAGNSVSYTEAGGATTIDAGLTLSDVDNQTLASATVSIGGFVAGDTLNFTDQNGITHNYDTSTGILTLTGMASVADYQAALRTITFSSSSQNPTSFGTDTSRTISWTVNDDSLDSTAVTSTVAVTAVDNPPVVGGAGNSTSYTEAGSATAIDAGLTLSDADSQDLASATVSIGGFVAGDTLTFTNQNGITGSYDSSTGILTLSGSASVADYQAALRTITFSSSSQNPTSFGTDTSRTINWTVNDGSFDSTVVTSTAAVTAVDNAPVLGGAGNSVGYTSGGSAPTIDAGLTISDVDSQDLASATVSIGGFVSGDALNFTNQNGITGSYDSSTGILTLSGAASVADYQAALRTITFSSSSQNPTSFGADTSRTISWTVNDGSSDSTAVTSTVAVTAVDSAPVVGGAGNSVSYTEAGSATAIDTGLTLSDADSQDLASATVSIGGFVAGDALNFTNQNGITGSYDASTGILTLSGSASVADYQAALQSVTFSSASQNPTSFGTDTSRTVSWTVNDGSLDSTAATSTVTVTAVDNAPVLGGAGNSVGYTSGGGAVTIDAGLTIGDADSQTLAGATVSIGGFLSGDTLSFTNQNGITGSYDSSTGVLTLTGAASVADYQAALRSVSFVTSNPNPTASGADPSRTISWTVNDGALDSPAATSTVLATANSPAVVNTTMTLQPQASAATPQTTSEGASILRTAGLQTAIRSGSSFESAGLFADTSWQTDESIFVSRPIGDVEISGAFVNFTLPRDAFVGTAPGLQLTLVATQADGKPLPAWLSFDPATGHFEGTPPAGGVPSVDVRVIAHDAAGHEAVQVFKLVVPKASEKHADATPGGVAPVRTASLGKPGLTAQLKAMGREGRVARLLSTLDAAHPSGRAA